MSVRVEMPQKYIYKLGEADLGFLRNVADAYGLGGPPEDVVRLVVWGDRMVATFSAAGRRFFLKAWCDFHETDEEIAFCLDIQESARDGGLPVPQIFRTQTGGRVYSWEGQKFTLYAYVGEAYNPEKAAAEIFNCARALGVLHTATMDSDIGGKRWRDDPFGLSVDRLRGTEEEIARARLSAGEKATLSTAVRRLSEFLELARRNAYEDGWNRLPVQPIHGDFCQFNCRFSASDVVGVVDWDHARLGPRLLDIAQAVNIGLGWATEIDHYEDFTWADARPLEIEQVSTWLTAYLSEARPLTATEARLLPWACAALWPWHVGGFWPQNSDAWCAPDAVTDYVGRIVDRYADLVELVLITGGS